MEPPTTPVKGVRYKLVLGKYRVCGVKKTPTGFEFALDMNGVKIVVYTATPNADIREEDQLTLYTEIFCHPPKTSEMH